MTDAPALRDVRSISNAGRREPTLRAELLAVALVSAALLACEIVLMRRLLIERWHHFGYLVISVALLGFGASGTLLAVIERRVRAQPGQTLRWSAAALAPALLLLPRLAALLPARAQFIPGDLWAQVGWWALYWLTACIPFLTGATFLGAALTTAGPHVGRVYAANLLGSGLGAAVGMLVISRCAPEHALWPAFLAAGGAALILWRDGLGGGAARTWSVVATCVTLGAAALAADARWPLTARYDEHKYAARLAQLVAQGAARRVAARADPHGYVELYESRLFHELPFLALRRPPPALYSLVVNGDPAGSVLRIADAAEAEVLDETLMAFPYRLIRRQPNVLLIGEAGGANVWLARRREAARIDVVQPNGAIVELVRRFSPPVFADAAVCVRTQDPRAFLAGLDRPAYDLIQIAALEGFGVGGAGLRGLAEDHLATVEGFAECLRALRDEGLLAISRGVEHPPRENVRLLATLVEALESLGVTDASRNVIQVRDYLGVCTLATRQALDDARRDRLRSAIGEFNLTPVWYDGLPLEEVNQPDALDGPPGTGVDWLHHAAHEILSPRRQAFYDAWLLNVRPVHDDNPFFWDFYKPGAIAALKRAYGDLWLTRAELGRLFLYASLVIASGAAVLLIVLPLALVAARRRATERCATASERCPSEAKLPRVGAGAADSRCLSSSLRLSVALSLSMIVYFAGIGLGFMGLEMALISRAVRWLGDPVLSSAAVIGGVLVLSGVGSLWAQRIVGARRLPPRLSNVPPAARAPLLAAAGALALGLLGWSSGAGRTLGGCLLLAVGIPAACCLGLPMPTGIRLLSHGAPRLVPWAWGVNGVASVMATSLAIVAAMNAGYRAVMLLSAAAYGLAAAAGLLLTRGLRSGKRETHAERAQPAA